MPVVDRIGAVKDRTNTKGLTTWTPAVDSRGAVRNRKTTKGLTGRSLLWTGVELSQTE